VKVGETKSERVMHVEFMKKMLSEGCEQSERMVKIVSVRVVILNQHTIKNKQIVGRTAEWCRVCWTADDASEKKSELLARAVEGA
jgi:hypothetical protein